MSVPPYSAGRHAPIQVLPPAGLGRADLPARRVRLYPLEASAATSIQWPRRRQLAVPELEAAWVRTKIVKRCV